MRFLSESIGNVESKFVIVVSPVPEYWSDAERRFTIQMIQERFVVA